MVFPAEMDKMPISVSGMPLFRTIKVSADRRTRDRRTRDRRARGFTLIELLVVLMVIGIAAAAVALSLRTGGTSQLQEEMEHFLLSARFISEQATLRSEEHTSELQSRGHLVCRLLLEKKKSNMH